MTSLYQKFKELSKDEILDIGQYYAVDDEGFFKFIEENWEENEENSCNFIRALVTVVVLLNDRPIGSEHEINLLNNFFNNTKYENNKIVNALNKYFNEAKIKEGGYDIVKAYQDKVIAREATRTLFSELQDLNYSNITSLFTPERISRLKKLNNTFAYVSTVIDGEIKTPKLGKIYVKGHDAKTLVLKLGKANYKFIGLKSGVYNIRNEENELMFQNNVSYNDQFSRLEKIVYVYGIDEAKQYVRDKVYNMTDAQDRIYHEQRKEHKSLKEYYREND